MVNIISINDTFGFFILKNNCVQAKLKNNWMEKKVTDRLNIFLS